MNFKRDFLFFSKKYKFDGFQVEDTSFLYIKCKKIIKKKKKKEEEERMNEVKDENFKHSTYIALNGFYMGKSLPWTNNIVI